MANLTSIQLKVDETSSPNEYLATIIATFEFAGAEHGYQKSEVILVPSEYVQVRDQIDHLLQVVAHAFKDLPNSVLQADSQLLRVTI